LDLTNIAARLDADEKLSVTYRFPVRAASGEVQHEIRTDRLLDVAEPAKLLYVSHAGDMIWIKVDEVIEIAPDGSA
jgi:hypothetical protein